MFQTKEELNVSINRNEHQEINSMADFAFLKGCLIPQGTSINTDIKKPTQTVSSVVPGEDLFKLHPP